jgi:hypothetical protein
MLKKSIKTTAKVCNGALIATLALNGYEVNTEKSYIEAYGENENLIIFPVSRCLSNREHAVAETTSVSASDVGLKKFFINYGLDPDLLYKEDVSETDLYITLENGSEIAVPCIGYCVAKYTYADLEVLVVPIYEMIKRTKRGGIYSIATKTGRYHYDYAKIKDTNKPVGALMRSFFKGEMK